MVGLRRRTASASTVATVDENVIIFYKENTILKPVSRRAHTDDWPCFLLADATVHHRDGTLANLLHVDLEGPFIIRGRVEVEKDQKRFLVNRHTKTRSHWVQIQNSVSFSIGLKDDGLSVPVLWASGEAGWYEIVPSQKYMAMCDRMFQGISLHYAILDQYEEALERLHKKKKNRNKTIHDVKLPMDNLLFKYAVTVGDGTTLPEAYRRCREQAIFLLSHFPKDTEFHNWLSTEFAGLKQDLAERESKVSKNANDSEPTPLTAVAYPPREKSSSLEVSDTKRKDRLSLKNSATRSTRSSEPVDLAAVGLSGDGLPTRSRSTKATRKPTVPGRPESHEQADVVMIDLLDDPPNPKMTQGRLRKRTALRVPTGTSEQPTPQDPSEDDIDSKTETESSISVLISALQKHRNSMLEALKEGGRGKHPDNLTPKSWQTKIYMECSIKQYPALSEICLYYARDFARLLGPEWHDSQFYQWAKEHEDDEPTFEHISEADMKRIVRRAKMPHTIAREGQASKGSKQPEPATAHSEKQPKRGRASGKAAGLRPSIGSKKRLRHEADSEDGMDLDEDGLPKKTSKKSRYFTDDENDEDAQDTASSDSDEQPESKDEPLTRVVVRAEKLPSTTPKGLNNTWICEEPDCGYIVRSADEEEGQDLISAHYEEHEKEARDVAEEAALNRVKLAVQESRGQLPVGHLLEKILSMGEKASQRRGDDAELLNGEPIPQPIKRTLLI
ncbi:hypothetical protein F5X99DRAFT_212655 [Biscogniauxia marginata]|nr:hypothetical protein F5X99DRAFT_212655 [Biscogniauxia marginata]